MKSSIRFCGFWFILASCVLHTRGIFAQQNMQQVGSQERINSFKDSVTGHFKYKIGAQFQVLNHGQPLENVQMMFSYSVAGQIGDSLWVDPTDASGRASIEIEVKHSSDSGYYTALAMDLLGREIGRWHSIPLVAAQQSVLRLEVGKPFERVSTMPLYTFDVTLDSAKTVVDSVIAGVYLPLQVKVLSHRFVDELGVWRVDESYKNEGVRVSVNAGDQNIGGVHWRGDGVTDLGDGQAILDGRWENGVRQIEVMSTRVLDDFSVRVKAFGGRGHLNGLTVDEGNMTRLIVRAIEDGLETTIVTGEFEVDVLPTDSWGNLSTKIHHKPWDVDSLTLSRELLDSRIETANVLKDIQVQFSANIGDVMVPSGRVGLPVLGSRFTVRAPNRKGEGLRITSHIYVDGQDTLDTIRPRPPIGVNGATPPLAFLPEDTAPEPQVEPPEEPANLVVQDYKGVSGAGDEGGYLLVSFPVSIDHESLSNYRIDREIQITTKTDDAGNVIVLEVPERKWISWTSLDPVDHELDIMRVVIPVTDNLATRWAIAAERKGSNDVVASSGRTVADGFVAAVDNIPPRGLTNARQIFRDGAMHISWDLSKDDRTVGFINYRGVASPIKGVVSYEVYRGVSADNLVLIDTLPSGSTSYVDEQIDLADINRVRYRVDPLDLDNRTSGTPIFANGTKPILLNSAVFVRSFGAKRGHSHYILEADLDGDGMVGFVDFLFYLETLEDE